MKWQALSDKVLAGGSVTREEARAILDAGDDELLDLIQAAFRIRLKYYGRGIRIHILQNAKKGMCRENCKFCSQAIGSYSGVDRYRMQTVEELVEGARRAHAKKAVKYCMVTATRTPSPKEMETVCEAVRQIKAEMNIDVCTSLGLLSLEQAQKLKDAGVDRFNHNLETSSRYYPEVCNTHTFEDRVSTIRNVRAVGMEACCGGIVGMGETLEDRIELAFALRELEVESIPVNFMDPRPGTPLEDVPRISAQDCLRSLCMFRFVNPTRDIRAAGGREVCLRDMQVMALYVANSIFSEGYLTTPGQGNSRDAQMIEDAGFFVEELIPEEGDCSDADPHDHDHDHHHAHASHE